MNSIIDELNRSVPAKNKHVVIENRAKHVIASVQNLVELIRDYYTLEESEELIKRLQKSILTGDDRKFTRKINEIKTTSKSRNNDQ
jgi:hypothetical protein